MSGSVCLDGGQSPGALHRRGATKGIDGRGWIKVLGCLLSLEIIKSCWDAMVSCGIVNAVCAQLLVYV